LERRVFGPGTRRTGRFLGRGRRLSEPLPVLVFRLGVAELAHEVYGQTFERAQTESFALFVRHERLSVKLRAADDARGVGLLFCAHAPLAILPGYPAPSSKPRPYATMKLSITFSCSFGMSRTTTL